MIALGITEIGAGGVQGGDPLHVDRSGVVLAPGALAEIPRARLALQLQAYRTLAVFVPFAGRGTVSAEVAQGWVSQNRQGVDAALDRLRGQGQITLIAHPPAFPQGGLQTGTDWMRQKMQARQARSDLADHVTALVSPQALDHRISEDGAALAVHLLAPKAQIQNITEQWRVALSSAHPLTRGWRFAITGGWPPAAFCDIAPTLADAA